MDLRKLILYLVSDLFLYDLYVYTYIHILILEKLYIFIRYIYIFSMNNPNVLLRDIRNIKKNNTITFSMTSKEITGSVKDLKKARSSEQLVNLKGFLEVNII